MMRSTVLDFLTVLFILLHELSNSTSYFIPARYTKLQEQYNDAFKAMQEQKQLIAQLEEDLRSVNALSSMFRGDAEVQWVPEKLIPG